MLTRSLRRGSPGRARRWTSAAAVSLLSLAAVPALHAQDAAAQSQPPLPAVSIGGGVQTSFVHTEPEVGDRSDTFALNSVRLYVTGSATRSLKLMFNTEYDGPGNRLTVLDAVARYEPTAKFNVWFGRFLPPSDRANLYGPYYSHHWATFQDGVQDGYPFIHQGRDNGVAYWGQFDKVKVSVGAFDGLSATGDDTLIGAARVQVDFWDQEEGYYLNGTYYGDKNLLAIGVAAQNQGSEKNAFSVDFLLERKIGTLGSFYSVEAEWARYDRLGGYNARYGVDDGGYVLGSYMFPALVGPGRFEVLGKFARARFREGIAPIDADYDQKTTEIDLNYVVKQFNSRLMMFYKDTRFDAVRSNFKQIGVGLQIQM